MNVTPSLITREVAAYPVGIVRMIIGLASVCALLEAGLILTQLTAPETIHTPYFDGMPNPLSAPLSYLSPLIFAGTLLFTIGWHTRTAGAAIIVGIGYILLYDQQMYSNHLYLLGLLVFLLMVGDSGANLSLDAMWQGGRRTVKAWPILLMKIQICVVYLFAGLSKVNPDYLSGNVLLDTLDPELMATPFFVAWTPMFLPILAYASIGVELFIPLGLWFPRVRWVALASGIGLHTMIVFLMGWSNPLLAFQLTVFALTILSPYLLFFINGKECTDGNSTLA